MSEYCAAKAALYAYSKCLRLELAPLSVNVTYIMTGEVKTNGTKPSQFVMSENSLWNPVRDEFVKEQVRSARSGMMPEVFAKGFVGRILGVRKDVVWVGSRAVMCRIMGALEW
ncbi:hypothetical protein P280DRAFT_40201 [Massarina eburnea CBS 473.64]|uniref:NAD(P)-binding protein n=1 Tax=Massarina eburnea CBS 473.64 TaxID=1395130 RepID=A0A6A6RYP3_9PLEO|nr:hypothetical protein P280DRAFT_40201 [Massarina eburnea CBS 473.64]